MTERNIDWPKGEAPPPQKIQPELAIPPGESSAPADPLSTGTEADLRSAAPSDGTGVTGEVQDDQA